MVCMYVKRFISLGGYVGKAGSAELNPQGQAPPPPPPHVSLWGMWSLWGLRVRQGAEGPAGKSQELGRSDEEAGHG